MIGSAELAVCGEEVDVVARALGDASGAPFASKSGIRSRSVDGSSTRARQHVRAGLARLLEHRDRQRLAALLLLQLRQPQRGRQPGGAAADDQDVDFEGLARHVGHVT